MTTITVSNVSHQNINFVDILHDLNILNELQKCADPPSEAM